MATTEQRRARVRVGVRVGLGVQSTALLAVEVGETISRLPKRMQPSLGCALVFKAMRAILSYSEARLPQLAECLAAMLHMLKYPVLSSEF